MSDKKYIYYTDYHSAIGPLTVAATQKGICAVQFGDKTQTLPSLKAWSKKQHIPGHMVEDKAPFMEAVYQLEEYFSHHRQTFDLPFDLYGTSFQKVVWNALSDIPYGETRSYKQIAAAIGAPKAVRAIGGANNKNPLPILLPCHRVIGNNGNMVGYGGGIDKKVYLLRLEGAISKVSS
ncbi:methylated-DNA-[protein]-cysteine S-methyltransferase [Alteribacillus persepolensis]|uniref:Methylated-DNA--protein-cysteine methyltransferase n=1 Tax=Alteribacillus persepolensis TaxID=568899 RepID=A0A1G8D8X2_9BACI|nr:methylated-DNA--[protein]-cysteine S-methyltransferase [Alteribacillus persepolensis]SDH54112.1 methylated-DNA-[protein]-cysteine S-methyltransferase [Alteribacillus persepolensis]